MYRNVINSENTVDSHKEVIKGQIDGQLAQAAENENLEAIKIHFIFVLVNDFYKNELSAEQISSMESYLPANYADDYQDLPE
jgi:hypothetical protein|tara:strand:- start:1925 stop:2170 length:246 start_codon:yes stop_codon:yes gene_type:complete